MTTQTIAGAVPATRERFLRRAMAVTLGALVVALSAQFEIPLSFSPIPITLQGAALILVGLALGPRYGALALVTYVTMGLAGLPVFSGASFGFLKLLGPTGGYLIAFPLAAWVAGYVAVYVTAIPPAPRYLLAALAAMVTVHLGGWAWLSIVTHDPRGAFAAGVVPFVLIDLAKVVLAAAIGLGLGGRVRRLL
jgi:biotin transport system substrate-specific component